MKNTLDLRVADIGVKLHLEGVRLERNPGLYGRFIGGFPSEDIRLRVVETKEVSPRPEKPGPGRRGPLLFARGAVRPPDEGKETWDL